MFIVNFACYNIIMISVDEKTDISKNGDTLLLQHYSRVVHINKDRKSLISSGISDARLCR